VLLPELLLDDWGRWLVERVLEFDGALGRGGGGVYVLGGGGGGVYVRLEFFWADSCGASNTAAAIARLKYRVDI